MTEQMHTPLKPCPFCGGEAEGIGWNAEDYSFRVHCSGCTVTGEYCDTSDQAIAAWNRRADAAPGILEALKAIHDWQAGSEVLPIELWQQMRAALSQQVQS